MMEIKDIRKLAKMVSDNELTRFALKDGEMELEFERGNPAAEQVVMQQVPQPTQQFQPAAAAQESQSQQQEEAPQDDRSGLVEVTSPIVGTFYRAPSPESDPYVNVGTEVHEESVVCIVEAMKVMNEIHAETSGIIREILVENATPVQFGQPLFLVEPR